MEIGNSAELTSQGSGGGAEAESRQFVAALRHREHECSVEDVAGARAVKHRYRIGSDTASRMGRALLAVAGYKVARYQFAGVRDSNLGE